MVNIKKTSLTSQILIALIVGIILGYLMQSHAQLVNEYIKPIGDIFLNLLKFIVVPLVLLSIICGIISMRNISDIGRLGIRTLAYFMLTTIIAASLGLFVSTMLKGYFPIIDIPTSDASQPFAKITFIDQIVSFFPNNFFTPMLGSNMMQVIVIAVLVGFAIVKVGEKARLAGECIKSFYEVVLAILNFIMKLTPIGVFCMICPVVATNGSAILGSYAFLLGMDYLCFLLHAILVYGLFVFFWAKISPSKFFKAMTPAMLFAYSSDSSLATLPITMRCTEKLGVPKRIGDFVLTLGATINMDGVAIYLGVTAVFIATCCGIDLTMQQYLAIGLSSTIVSIGTPGIPGGSLALMAMVFASAGIPVEGVAIAAGIDRLVDMARTTMSITGDASCAVIMARLEKRKEADKN